MTRFAGLLLGLVLLVVVVASTFYTIDETEQVIITQFGEPVGPPRTSPGLHVKIPFIQVVHSFDKRWLEWSGAPEQIPTRDKKYIWVDTYCRWRISDPLTFYQRVRDERGAQSRLDDIVDGETRNVIANHDLIEVVRSSNRAFAQTEESTLEGREAEARIRVGRAKITHQILEKSRRITASYGIELVDVELKRIGYVAEVQQKVYERMISERKRIAERSRSEGLGKSAEIRGQKERELKGIESEAYRRAQEVMGRADGESAAIYADAYSRNAEFYEFLKTMEAYRKAIASDSLFILSTEGDFFKYLNKSAR
ncbi:MAG: protease modulator HflC [Acidobacteria bacterium]|nr:protease modulator HflC [Acidobacteriota bacterium]